MRSSAQRYLLIAPHAERCAAGVAAGSQRESGWMLEEIRAAGR
jgi:hypothetical protein